MGGNKIRTHEPWIKKGRGPQAISESSTPLWNLEHVLLQFMGCFDHNQITVIV